MLRSLLQKRNLKGLTLKELQEFAVSMDEPAFRGKQLFDWLYRKEATSFAEMTSLSKNFRAKLDNVATIENLRFVEDRHSPVDGTTKFLFELSDGKRIESVLIPSDPADDDNKGLHKRARLTLCVSTQVGCPLDCAFCATGTMGFTRNLTTGEIIDQVFQARRISRDRITNLVYMGMGEPLMNYDSVMRSVEIVTGGMGIAARRITVSTAGWADRIKQMADEHRKVKLAVSLHSLDDRLRTELMPINKKFSLERLIDAVQYYYRKTKLRVTYEYILFDGLTDREEDLRNLVNLSKVVPCKINIVPFHSIDFTKPEGFSAFLKPTPSRRAEQFIQKLRNAHVTVFVRSSAGEDIDAACGQLAILNPKHTQKRKYPITPEYA
jgi:23S rRNA (adenine2503-C2)-methyltransferase